MNKMSLLFVLFEWGLCESCFHLERSQSPSHTLINMLCECFPQRDVPVCEAGDCVKGCAHCGAFMSPAMSWQDCGQRFFCPFCDKLNEGKSFLAYSQSQFSVKAVHICDPGPQNQS